MYGVHPFVMGQDPNNNWYGVFSNNAAAQDWWITKNHTLGPYPGDVSIKQYATGGQGDIFIFSGNSPKRVNYLYHYTLVGFPALTPQWALGWG